ncbi:MAG: hypothetical protein OHK0046_39570 [Anaerolineae bacterium]
MFWAVLFLLISALLLMRSIMLLKALVSPGKRPGALRIMTGSVGLSLWVTASVIAFITGLTKLVERLILLLQ